MTMERLREASLPTWHFLLSNLCKYSWRTEVLMPCMPLSRSVGGSTTSYNLRDNTQ